MHDVMNIIMISQMNESDDYQKNPMEIVGTDPSEKKTYLIIFARITLLSDQSSRLRTYIEFSPVPILGFQHQGFECRSMATMPRGFHRFNGN